LASESLTLSYGNHPEMPVFMQLVEDAYARLGYQTEFIQMPQRRGLMALSAGEVDADVMRLRAVAESTPNSVIVPNFSIRTIAVLLCRKTIPCNQGELFNSGNKVVSVNLFERIIREHYKDRFKAQLHIYDTLSTPIALLEKGRIDYALYVFEATQLPTNVRHFATVLPLFETEAVHVVHAGRLALVGDLSRVLNALAPRYLSAGGELQSEQESVQ
jgi:hypothetical protein